MVAIINDQFSGMLETMSNIVASGDKHAATQWSAEYRQFRIEIEARLSNETGFKGTGTAELSLGARHRQFASDILPSIQGYLQGLPRGTVLDVLDAECGYGYSTDLIASLYATSALGYRMRMGACTSEYNRLNLYVRSNFRSFTLYRDDVSTLRRKFDLVLSIFHLQRHTDAPAMLRRLCELATRRVFVLAPYVEKLPLTRGHRLSIDVNLLDECRAENVRTFRSPGWGFDDSYSVVSFELPGTAS